MKGDRMRFVDPEQADALDLLSDGALGLNGPAEDFSGLSRAHLYRENQAGRLPFVKQGRRTLIPKRALVRLLANGMRGGKTA
jgi:hypothetical protein